MSGNSVKYVLIALAILLLTALGCSSTSTLAPTLPPPRAPTRSPVPTPLPGRYGIFIMRLDSTELRQIYSTDRQPSGLRPSADGSQILFQFYYQDMDGDGEYGLADVSAIEVGLLDIDGSNFRRLTDDDYIDALPLWSPDGAEILLTSNRGDGEKLDLFVMDTAGRTVRQLTQTPNVHEGDPDWVGDTIVYTRNADDEEVQSIWAMSPDGSNARQVTFPPAKGKSDLVFEYGDFDPGLSPDGQQVAFERLVDDEFFFVDRQIGRWDIFVADVDNPGNERKLTDEQEAAALPKWSPDGRTILFVSYHLENGNPAVALFTIGADGSNRQKVNIPLRNFAPLAGAWMPDGEHIVFAGEIYR